MWRLLLNDNNFCHGQIKRVIENYLVLRNIRIVLAKQATLASLRDEFKWHYRCSTSLNVLSIDDDILISVRPGLFVVKSKCVT